jgi:chromosome segregation ATPase
MSVESINTNNLLKINNTSKININKNSNLQPIKGPSITVYNKNFHAEKENEKEKDKDYKDDKDNFEQKENEYLLQIETYYKQLNEIKKDLKEKVQKLEGYNIERNKLVYQIQNYERYLKEREKSLEDKTEKINQLELQLNTLNCQQELANKENIKIQKTLTEKYKDEISNKEESIKKNFFTQISDLKNQLNQYKIELQGKNKIIEERNDEIRALKAL